MIGQGLFGSTVQSPDVIRYFVKALFNPAQAGDHALSTCESEAAVQVEQRLTIRGIRNRCR